MNETHVLSKQVDWHCIIMRKETCLNWSLIKKLQSAGGKWKIRKYGFGFCSQITKGAKKVKEKREREREMNGDFCVVIVTFVMV